MGHELCALPAVGPLALSCGPGTTGRLGLAVGGSRSGDTAETRARPGPRGFLQGALGWRREKLLVPAKPDSDTKAGPSRHAQGTMRRGACSVGRRPRSHGAHPGQLLLVGLRWPLLYRSLLLVVEDGLGRLILRLAVRRRLIDPGVQVQAAGHGEVTQWLQPVHLTLGHSQQGSRRMRQSPGDPGVRLSLAALPVFWAPT